MKIVCNLPNASECINGIEFKKQDGMMVSVLEIDDIEQAQVERLLSIDGYALIATQEEVDALPEDMQGPDDGNREPQVYENGEPVVMPYQAEAQESETVKKTTRKRTPKQ